jgi:uncharacterized membrane protein
MEHLQSSTDILRKLALWTLIGFVVLVLLGPILTVVGVALPFAIVGFLVWLAFRAVVSGPRAVGRTVGQTAGAIFRTIAAVPHWVGVQLAAAIRFATRTVRGAVAMLFPVVTGAFLGGLLGAIGGMQHHDADFRVPAGVVIGAGVGLLAGALRTKRERVPVLEPAREAVHGI